MFNYQRVAQLEEQLTEVQSQLLLCQQSLRRTESEYSDAMRTATATIHSQQDRIIDLNCLLGDLEDANHLLASHLVDLGVLYHSIVVVNTEAVVQLLMREKRGKPRKPAAKKSGKPGK